MSTIAIDFDGIVVDCLPTLLASYNLQFNDFVQVEDVTDYDLRKACKKTLDGRNVFSILNAPGFYRHLPPIPGALAGIARLRASGHNAVFVTSRPPRAEAETKEWVLQHVRDDSTLICFTDCKEDIQADVIFDDSPQVLHNYNARWPAAGAATIAYPYNVGAHQWARVVGHYTQPAAAWTAFVDWIEGYLW